MSAKAAKRRRQEMRADIARAKETVVPFLREQLGKLRGEFARRLKIQRQKFPKMKLPCETCAFRTSADFTDGDDGFLRTTVGVVNALARGREFLCHDEKLGPDGQYRPRFDKSLGLYVPCAGWMVLASTTPEPVNVRELLGDSVVALCVDGDSVLNQGAPSSIFEASGR